ncbi:MAG TPA: LysM peptidoglycan-binding domain-containing protein, partial [Candidatus Paceibacterota bacterium]
GDTLSAIAKRLNTTVANLMKLNSGLIKDANKLKIGWELRTSAEPPKDVAAGPKKGPLTGKITAPEAKTGIFGSAEAAQGPAAAPQQYSEWRNGAPKPAPAFQIPVESAPTPAPTPAPAPVPFNQTAMGSLHSYLDPVAVLSGNAGNPNFQPTAQDYLGTALFGMGGEAPRAEMPPPRPTGELPGATPLPSPPQATPAVQNALAKAKFSAPPGRSTGIDPWTGGPGPAKDPNAWQTNTIDEPRIPPASKLTNAVPKGHKEIEVQSPAPMKINASDLKSVEDFRNALRSTSDNTVVLNHASDLGFNSDTVVIKGDGTWGEKADPISLLTTDATPVLSPKAFLTAVDYMKKNGF